MNFFHRQCLKLRLFRLGERPTDKNFLLKPYIRFYLRKLGVSHDWSDAGITVGIKTRARRFEFKCRDSLSDAAVLAEVFAEQQYLSPFPISGVSQIVDLGANIGAYAAFAHARFPTAEIACVEADPENVMLLRENIRINSLPCVVISAAVTGARRRGHVPFINYGPSTSRAVCIDGNQPHIQVPGIPLDEVLSGLRGETVDVLKCDIEGAEGEVFDALTPAVTRRLRHLVIEYHSPALRTALRARLAADFNERYETAINGTQGLLWFSSRAEPRDTW